MLRYMFITNDPKLASRIDADDVWIWVDLETLGKQERQAGRDTVISNHTVTDVGRVKHAVKKSRVIVRCNPIGSHSKAEINAIIDQGADIVMLPFFSTVAEVETFLELVSCRAEVMLLLETKGAAQNITEILEVGTIDYVHIGLNDLHMQHNMKFMFELYSDGIIENIVGDLQKAEVAYGFGGVARLDAKLKPHPRLVLAEHKRLGSSLIILSRSFLRVCDYDDVNILASDFETRLEAIRYYYESLSRSDENKLLIYKRQLDLEIQSFVQSM